jgi:hypothetical protein
VFYFPTQEFMQDVKAQDAKSQETPSSEVPKKPIKSWILEMQDPSAGSFAACVANVGDGNFTCRMSLQEDGIVELRLDHGGHLQFWLTAELDDRPGDQLVPCRGRFEFPLEGGVLQVDKVSLVFSSATNTATLMSPSSVRPLLTFTLTRK